MINLGLIYEDPVLGTSFNLLFNRIGPRIVEVATAYEEDVIEQPRNLVDVTITQPLFRQFELRLAAKDILAREQVFLQGEKKARSNKRGAIYSIGLSFKF
jgi:hypothetical protein